MDTHHDRNGFQKHFVNHTQKSMCCRVPVISSLTGITKPWKQKSEQRLPRQVQIPGRGRRTFRGEERRWKWGVADTMDTVVYITELYTGTAFSSGSVKQQKFIE